jgi:DNA mismatch repair protein MutS2
METEELQVVADLSHRIERVEYFLRAHAADAPLLAEDADHLFTCPAVHQEIDRCLTPSGDVADAASPELGRLRRERRRLETSIRTELESLLRDPSITSLLQDRYHTERSGRHVLPLAVNHRGKLPGIVHDRSASGETLFVPGWCASIWMDSRRAWKLWEASMRWPPSATGAKPTASL